MYSASSSCDHFLVTLGCVVWLLGACLVQECSAAGANNFNVIDYGAVADGQTDDSQAFGKAWAAACGATGSATLVIPGGNKFLVGPTSFNGTCKSNSVHVQVLGTILAPSSTSAWKETINSYWLVFYKVQGLIIDGTGTLNGQGAAWWACRKQPQNPCPLAPMALSIVNCQHVTVSGLQFLDSPGVHLKVVDSQNVQLNDLNIQAPADSPNTDGINIGNSQFVYINGATIMTGDDCIAMITGSFDINITGITCGPGHGISVGSLGDEGTEGSAGRIYVKNASFTGTQNGIHIKTWQGGSGTLQNVNFEQLRFNNAGNPIFIDQYYCPHASCPEKPSAVKISQVSFSGANGTSSTAVAINLSCSRTVACTGIILDTVDLTSTDPAHPATSNCINAFGSTKGNVIPAVRCLS